jgi:peptide/nickel transport system substrate-binding protein
MSIARGKRRPGSACAQIAPIALCVGTAFIAACGSSGPASTTATTAEGKRGGTLRVLYQGDVDFIDPGKTYYNGGYIVTEATQRPLVNYKPSAPEQAVPDLAATLPVVSADGKTVTVKIRRGVRFSPPVNREVTSRDVKYAIERGFFKTVANGYAPTYFGNVVGVKPGVAPGATIAGIQTPDDATIVFRLSRPTGGVVAGALALPLSSPVPAEYAAKYDRHNPSDYGTHQVATGPYMIANDAGGKTVGYQAGRFIHLVRNRNWRAATDYRPAYLDRIDIDEGNTDTNLAAQKILSGRHVVSGEFPAPAEVIAQALKTARGQITLMPTGAIDYVPLNTAIPPFNDLNVRRAVVAGADRDAIRKTAGGAIRGALATHLIPPSIPGYRQAGGARGDGLDFLANPHGDPAVAAKYLRQAGYASGRYDGNAPVLLVSINDPGTKLAGQLVQRDLTRLGFKVEARYVTAETFFTKFCGVPASKVNACVGWGWLRDFPDAQTILDPTFNGKAIQAAGNSNVPQLNVPAINAAMARAEALTRPAARAEAWAAVDRQVTAQAPAILGTWTNQPIIRAKDVAAVPNANIVGWDLAFTSLR